MLKGGAQQRSVWEEKPPRGDEGDVRRRWRLHFTFPTVSPPQTAIRIPPPPPPLENLDLSVCKDVHVHTHLC